MKLLIDVDEETYNRYVHWKKDGGHIQEAEEIIANGIPYNPTGDLISREALKEAVKNRFDNSEYFPFHFLALIDNAPPVDAIVNTIEVRTKGEWIEYNATGKKQYMCSECSMKEKNPKIARYCYWCGAKMKGGAE